MKVKKEHKRTLKDVELEHKEEASKCNGICHELEKMRRPDYATLAACPECGSTMWVREGIYVCRRCDAAFVFTRVNAKPQDPFIAEAERNAREMAAVREHDVNAR